MFYPNNEYEIDFDKIARRITIEEFAREIGAERAGSSSWRCPRRNRHNNRDRNPSFSIDQTNGRVVAHCFGCGLTGSPVQVYAELEDCEESEAARRLADAIGLSTDEEPSSAVAASAGREEEEVYTYTDEEGEPLFEVVRLPEKEFRMRRPDGSGGWVWNLEGVDRVLYRLPQVIDAAESGETVYIVEGEKDVHAIEDRGGTATCNPNGAGNWKSKFNRFFENAEVVIIADRDGSGREHAWDIAHQLERIADSVEVREPAVEEVGADVSDHLDVGYTLSNLIEVTEDNRGTGEQGSVSTVRVDSASEDWEEPIPLGPEPPSDLSPDVLPSPLQEHVSSVADSMQVPVGLPLGMSLAAVSASVCGKAEVKIRSGWSAEPLNIYTAIVLESANRKSAVEAEMVQPIREWESTRAEELRSAQRTALDEKEILEDRLNRAMREAAQAESREKEEQALEEVWSTRQRLEEIEIPHPPQLITSDVTEEALGRLMARQHGRASIISSEGDVLRIFAGRYSKGTPALGLLKKAHTGDSHAVDRLSRDAIRLPQPLLTVGITLQPKLLDSLSNHDILTGEGVLGRFLWIAPPSMIGSRLTGRDVPKLDQLAQSQYGDVLDQLLKSQPERERESGEWDPYTLDLTSEAKESIFDFEAAVEGMLAPGGRLASIRRWGGKLVGNIARVAGLLQVVRRVHNGHPPYSAPVTAESMEAAVKLGQSLIPHAQFVLATELEVDEDLELARYVLTRIQEADNEDELTVRNLQRLTDGKPEIQGREDLEEVLDRLAEHHLVRREERDPGPEGGRPPSPVIHLNPYVLESRKFPDKTDKTNQLVEGEGGSVGSVRVGAGPGGREGGAEAEPSYESAAAARDASRNTEDGAPIPRSSDTGDVHETDPQSRPDETQGPERYPCLKCSDSPATDSFLCDECRSEVREAQEEDEI